MANTVIERLKTLLINDVNITANFVSPYVEINLPEVDLVRQMANVSYPIILLWDGGIVDSKPVGTGNAQKRIVERSHNIKVSIMQKILDREGVLLDSGTKEGIINLCETFMTALITDKTLVGNYYKLEYGTWRERDYVDPTDPNRPFSRGRENVLTYKKLERI